MDCHYFVCFASKFTHEFSWQWAMRTLRHEGPIKNIPQMLWLLIRMPSTSKFFASASNLCFTGLSESSNADCQTFFIVDALLKSTRVYDSKRCPKCKKRRLALCPCRTISSLMICSTARKEKVEMNFTTIPKNDEYNVCASAKEETVE